MFSSSRLDYASYLRAEDVCVYIYVLIQFTLTCNLWSLSNFKLQKSKPNWNNHDENWKNANSRRV